MQQIPKEHVCLTGFSSLTEEVRTAFMCGDAYFQAEDGRLLVRQGAAEISIPAGLWRLQ